jgi:hypothetical protein
LRLGMHANMRRSDDTTLVVYVTKHGSMYTVDEDGNMVPVDGQAAAQHSRT